jgi:xylulokinase
MHKTFVIYFIPTGGWKMNKLYLIGVDIGTQGTKTALFTETGEHVVSAFEPSNLISPEPGTVEQDPEEIYQSVLNTIRAVIGKSGICPSEVGVIGIDGQMAGILGIDENYNAVTPYDSWLDIRCSKYVQFIKQRAEEKVISLTGCPVTYTHGPKVLWWKYERQQTYEKISKFVVPTAFVGGKLAGLKGKDAYIDYTQIHFSGFADVLNLQWSYELLDIFDVGAEKLPKIVKPWEIIGHLTKEAAACCGLVAGIPIIAGCGDQAATSLGAGISRPGIALDVAGTASVFACCVDQFKPDIKYKTLIYPRSIIENLWLPIAYINGGGLCMRWFKEQVAGSAEMPITYPELESLALHIPAGSNKLLFIPHFNGCVCPFIDNVKGSFLGLNLSHSREHMFKAVMESIGYEYSTYMGILDKLGLGKDIKVIHAVGGGSKSLVFDRIKCDILGLPYQLFKAMDCATLGSVITAGYAIGLYKNIAETADRMIEKTQKLLPDNEKREQYKSYVELYTQAIHALEETYQKMDRI